MIRITQLKLPVSHSQEELRKKIARSLRCSPDDLSYEIIRQSLDARHKDDKKFVYTVDVTVSGEKKILKKVHNNNIMYTPLFYISQLFPSLCLKNPQKTA